MRIRLTEDKADEILIGYRQGARATDLSRKHGVSRQAIYALLRRNGVPRREHGHVERKCGHCGAALSVLRHRANRNRLSFCTAACYMAHLRNPDYQQWRHGCRLARFAVIPFFDLREWHVVHHIDQDNANNDPGNLMVFASSGDHTRWHRQGGEASGVTPLWRGDQ